jgi:urease accessory protein
LTLPNRRVSGAGSLLVTRAQERSVVTRARATSPLKWLTPQNHGHAAWIFASSYGGGLVDGDALDIDITVEAGASALLCTQASTKVYRSARGTGVTLVATLAEGATLVSLPDPVVCFADARYRQAQRFVLAGGATLVALDWMTSGRLGRGERWVFEEYASRTTIQCRDTPVVHDAMRLSRDDGDLARRFGRFDVLATVMIMGDALAREIDRIAATVGSTPIERRPSLLTTVASVAESGCMVRLAGMDLEEVRRAIRALLDFVPALLGDDPWARKW